MTDPFKSVALVTDDGPVRLTHISGTLFGGIGSVEHLDTGEIVHRQLSLIYTVYGRMLTAEQSQILMGQGDRLITPDVPDSPSW